MAEYPSADNSKELFAYAAQTNTHFSHAHNFGVRTEGGRVDLIVNTKDEKTGLAWLDYAFARELGIALIVAAAAAEEAEKAEDAEPQE